jgi:hypothetical protein
VRPAPAHAPRRVAELVGEWIAYATRDHGELCGLVEGVARFGDGWHAFVRHGGATGAGGEGWWIHSSACRPIDRRQGRLWL